MKPIKTTINNASQKAKQSTKKRFQPYAKIQWDKVASLFDHPPTIPVNNQKYPRVVNVLSTLLEAGDKGFTYALTAKGRGLAFMHPGFDPDWRFNQVIRQLQKRQFVRVRNNSDQSITVTVAKRGMIRALTYKLDTMTLPVPKRWDKKWRVVIFDIPVKFNRVRDLFRMRLGQLGLYRLQESVYISPYPCFDEIEFLRELYRVSFTIRYLLVERVEDDAMLKKHFRIDTL